MSKLIRGVTVRAPATTANMGPGFDSMGMALDIFNTISVGLANEMSISITGQGEGVLSRDADNMVHRGFAAVFQALGKRVPSIALRCHNEIPLRRGLGSSAAAVAGGMVAANVMSNEALPLEELLRLADGIEGHPDNVAPALFGGCQIVIREGPRLVSSSLPIDPGLRAVLLIPDFEIPTDKAREVLPSTVPITDAVYNIGRAALLAVSLATGDARNLRLATQDTLHQPAREPLFPAMKGIFKAALESGACGVFLSGSGSTVLALAVDDVDRVAKAMLDEAKRQGLQGTTRIARPWPQGVSVMETITDED